MKCSVSTKNSMTSFHKHHLTLQNSSTHCCSYQHTIINFSWRSRKIAWITRNARGLPGMQQILYHSCWVKHDDVRDRKDIRCPHPIPSSEGYETFERFSGTKPECAFLVSNKNFLRKTYWKKMTLKTSNGWLAMCRMQQKNFNELTTL